MGSRAKDLTGQRFGRLVVVSRSDRNGKNSHRVYWNCQCDCGCASVTSSGCLRSGNTKSCGCLMDEVRKKRISLNHSEFTAIILGYKRHAKDRGFAWNLSRQFVEDITQQDCHYCGCKPFNTKKTKNSIGDGLKYNGIDRIDSSRDYTECNVVACCRICNYAKSNMSIQDFQDWAINLGKKAMAEQWGGNNV